ncbi:DUF4372 domain-containing protein [uncultured Parasutterella sp.]|uniref:DUF4372 domain-containing protein n=1 Tax=uncultured Parasutterella sp. TaxID=1263098 RepID=UPI0033901208
MSIRQRVKGLTTWSQFIAMLFCQLSGADSLREISDGLYSVRKHFNPLTFASGFFT